MMNKPRKYRRLEDGHVFEAVQYTLSRDESWQHHNAITQVANFILNIDTDQKVGISNERILDVVHPIADRWQPQKGLATIEIIDPYLGREHQVELNDWICRHSSDWLVFMKPAAFEKRFVDLEVFESLANLIYENLPEKEAYKEAVEKSATSIIRAGWAHREGKT
jgi:hypothetical protein